MTPHKLILTSKSLQNFWWVLAALLYTLFHLKDPLYTSNQNTKFLHGAAKAGYGWLKDDWTANTIDPLPVFTTLVKLLYELNAIELSYLIFFSLLFIYFATLARIVIHLFPDIWTTPSILLYITIFFFLSQLGLNGLAIQYLLGSYLQPCVFGVFILFSFERFIKGHSLSASVWLAFSSAWHPAYLPSALLIQTTYTGIMISKRDSLREILFPLIMFFTISTPLVIRHILLFAPTSPEINSKALDILANQRIPHHTNIHVWFKGKSFIKLGIIASAILIIKRSTLSIIMLVLFLSIIISGIYLYIIPNTTIAFATPWRSSVFLMPISLAILSAFITSIAHKILSRNKVLKTSTIALMLPLIIYITSQHIKIQLDHFSEYKGGLEMGVISYTKKNAAPDQLYLVPFLDKKMWKFRLETGIPIFINYKTHPYKDIEVIKWYKRCELAHYFYRKDINPQERLNVLKYILSLSRITHIILPSNLKLQAEAPFKEIYRDDFYTLLKRQK